MRPSDVIPFLAEKKRRRALKTLGKRSRFTPGNISIAGWELEYLDGAAIASSIDVLVYRGWNDFMTESENPVILDCGANIGISVLNYLRRHPKASITAFEPDPYAARALRRNLSVNGAGEVRVVEAAVWTETGRAPFFVEGADGGRILSGEMASATIVECIDLKDFLAGPVDLIKMDIEGAEFKVIPHIAGRLSLVGNLIVECHLSNDDVTVFARLLQVLGDAGFSVSVNSYGAWRDLVHRPGKLPNEFDQYLLLAAWREPEKSPR
jgi:FkbM family methyltransferase